MKLPDDLRFTDIDTPLGPMRLAASARGLAGAWFHGQRHAPTPETQARWQRDDTHPVLDAARGQLAEYFAARRDHFALTLDLSPGTPLQRAVWQALLNIPPGHTLSYGELAARLDRPGAARAVAAAVGRNPVSIVVPCHRVVGARGALTGYAGGLPRKAALLDLESRRSCAP